MGVLLLATWKIIVVSKRVYVRKLYSQASGIPQVP